MTIQITAALLVFLIGLVGVVLAAVRGEYQGSTAWFLTSFWLACLASVGVIVLR
jgi:hypothetical protein